MVDDSLPIPQLVFAHVVGIEGEVYADELAALAEAGILLPTTSLRPDGGESIKASGLPLEFPKRLTDAQVARLIELKSSPSREPEDYRYPLLELVFIGEDRLKTAMWICGVVAVPIFFFGGIVGKLVSVAIGVVISWKGISMHLQKRESLQEQMRNRGEKFEAWKREARLSELARESLLSLTRSEFRRVFWAIEAACFEAVRECEEAFANEQLGSSKPIAWLVSCLADDGYLAVCRWDSGTALIKFPESEGGVVCIQDSGLQKVSRWLSDFEEVPTANGVDGQKTVAPVWLNLQPGMIWADVISFAKGGVHLSGSKSRKPSLRVGLSDLESVRKDYKTLIRAAIDGVVDARLPEVVGGFKEHLFRCVDEVCAQPTPRTAADSANLKILAVKIARTDAAAQALFAKLMTDPEFVALFEREVDNIRAERELQAMEAKLVAEAELREREVKALELKLAEDTRLEKARVAAEIELRKEHLALESKKQSELLEQLRRQADAAEDAVTMTRYQLQAMHEQTDATRRVAKEIEKQERKNRGEWSILDDWFGG